MALNLKEKEEKRRKIAQGLNKAQGERMRQKHMQELDHLLLHLRNYAKKHKIPQKPNLPKSFPMQLNEESLSSNIEYRNFIIRKNIDHGVETLLKCMRIKPSRYLGYFSGILTQKSETLSKLVRFLEKPAQS